MISDIYYQMFDHHICLLICSRTWPNPAQLHNCVCISLWDIKVNNYLFRPDFKYIVRNWDTAQSCGPILKRLIEPCCQIPLIKMGTMPQLPNVYHQTFAWSAKKDCYIAGALFSTLPDDTSEILQEKAFCQAYILPAHNPITLLMHSWPVICSRLSSQKVQG